MKGASTMPLTITQVDAFTARPFAGNPAGVCVLPSPREEQWMQNVALEMNLAETSFLLKQDDGYSLRWFTPVAEVDLCGHGTLAAAHVLWESGQLSPHETARFHSRSGLLTAERRADYIWLDFPATPAEPVPVPPELSAALGVTPLTVGRSPFDFVVELESEDAVRAVRPDLRKLAAIPQRGAVVTSRSADPAFDFVSRYFAPAFGIPEDPVTGSTHCALAPFWAAKLGKTSFRARQLSARGGVLHIELVGTRVRLGGQAVTVLRGELLA
jgi:PhzF family phenazine biosynthesis protein